MGNPKGRQVVVTPIGITAVDITGETVVIAPGIAGTVVEFYIEQKPLVDSNGAFIGGLGDTSLVLTSTTFDNEVNFNTPDDSLENGDYYIDYITGKGRGKKKDAGVSMTVDYKVFSQ